MSAHLLHRRLPFTLALLGLLLAIAIATQTHTEALSAAWRARLGFATRDFFLLNLERMLTSAFTTHGGPVFVGALLAVAAFVGAAEWRAGTRRALLVFAASHLLTLVGMALATRYALRSWHPPLADLLRATRDVGPSAGYFGCLALLCTTLPGRWRTAAAVAIEGLLAGALALHLRSHASEATAATAVSSALAHAIAFPVGWGVALGSARALDRGAPARGAASAGDTS